MERHVLEQLLAGDDEASVAALAALRSGTTVRRLDQRIRPHAMRPTSSWAPAGACFGLAHQVKQAGFRSPVTVAGSLGRR